MIATVTLLVSLEMPTLVAAVLATLSGKALSAMSAILDSTRLQIPPTQTLSFAIAAFKGILVILHHAVALVINLTATTTLILFLALLPAAPVNVAINGKVVLVVFAEICTTLLTIVVLVSLVHLVIPTVLDLALLLSTAMATLQLFLVISILDALAAVEILGLARLAINALPNTVNLLIVVNVQMVTEEITPTAIPSAQTLSTAAVTPFLKT
jgi:hypothetical protein